jgi:hypothetical protein
MMFGPKKDALYHELVDALAAGGCPVCRLSARAASHYLSSLMYEGITNPEARNRVRNGRGFCPQHAWEFAGQKGGVLSTAIVYKDLIVDQARIIREGDGKEREAPKCPACAEAASSTERMLHTLLAHHADETLAAAYQAHQGLCWPHLQQALARAKGKDGQSLRAWQGAIYAKLEAELLEVIRKHDHRFRSEPVGAEADAWERAVAAAVGERTQ